MLRRTLLAFSLVLASLSLGPSSVQAQEEEESAPLSAAPLEAKKGSGYNEVEHGFFVGAAAGADLYLSPPGTGGKFSMGQSGGVELGFEPTPMFAVGILAWGGNVGAPSSYQGTCTGDAATYCPKGNFTTFTLGADARLNLSLGADANGVKRTFFFIRAGAGYSIVRPANIISNELVVFGGPGIEYFTHLRHFSVGLEADGTFGLSNHGLAVLIQPIVRYTF